MSIEREIQSIYSQVLVIVDDGFQFDDFISIVGIIMKLVQAHEEWKGQGKTKKEVAVAVFQLYATESGMLTEDQALTAATFLLSTLPSLIDTLKSLARQIAKAGRKRRFGCC